MGIFWRGRDCALLPGDGSGDGAAAEGEAANQTDESKIKIKIKSKNKMTYKDIEGWMDFEGFYDWIVETAPATHITSGPGLSTRLPEAMLFVEVGCWKGKSSVYLARKIIESGKLIKVYCVDTWQGSKNEPNMVQAASESNIFAEFSRNIQECGCNGIILPHIMDSLTAAREGVADRGAWFVFIDADHTREAVEADIRAWLPKVAPRGIIAGHDWNTYASVREGVKAVLGDDVEETGNVWWKVVK